MSLRERLFFDLLFREMDLVLAVLRLDFLFSTSQLFPNCFCSQIYCKCFEFFTSTNNFPNLWSSNFKQICLNSFRSWDYIFFCLCKSSKTSSTMSCISSKNREISWILSNHFAWSLNQKWLFEILRNKRTTRVIPTDKKGIFSPVLSLSSILILWKKFFNSFLNCKFVKD